MEAIRGVLSNIANMNLRPTRHSGREVNPVSADAPNENRLCHRCNDVQRLARTLYEAAIVIPNKAEWVEHNLLIDRIHIKTPSMANGTRDYIGKASWSHILIIDEPDINSHILQLSVSAIYKPEPHVSTCPEAYVEVFIPSKGRTGITQRLAKEFEEQVMNIIKMYPFIGVSVSDKKETPVLDGRMIKTVLGNVRQPTKELGYARKRIVVQNVDQYRDEILVPQRGRRYRSETPPRRAWSASDRDPASSVSPDRRASQSSDMHY